MSDEILTSLRSTSFSLWISFYMYKPDQSSYALLNLLIQLAETRETWYPYLVDFYKFRWFTFPVFLLCGQNLNFQLKMVVSHKLFQ